MNTPNVVQSVGLGVPIYKGEFGWIFDKGDSCDECVEKRMVSGLGDLLGSGRLTLSRVSAA